MKYFSIFPSGIAMLHNVCHTLCKLANENEDDIFLETFCEGATPPLQVNIRMVFNKENRG